MLNSVNFNQARLANATKSCQSFGNKARLVRKLAQRGHKVVEDSA